MNNYKKRLLVKNRAIEIAMQKRWQQIEHYVVLKRLATEKEYSCYKCRK